MGLQQREELKHWFGLLVESGPDISKVSWRDAMFAQVKCRAVIRDVILFTDKCSYDRGVLSKEKRLRCQIFHPA